MMDRLSGKVAIVTGGGGALGRATALRLAAEGARVAVADIAAAAAHAAAEEIRSAGGQAIPVAVDLTDEESIEAMVAGTLDEFGRLDVLHNNAGATGREQLKNDRLVTTMPTAIWDNAMSVNVRGPMLACKHAIPAMLEAGGGSIINTASVAAFRGDSVRVAYGCSKAALLALTIYVASSFGKSGIRCNAVSPGIIMNPAVRARRSTTDLENVLRHYPSPRLGEPEDLAALVAYLASDESVFVNGQNISLDGAMSVHVPSMNEYA